MKLIKNLTLLFTIIIFAACTAGNETLLELDELTLEELEALATVGEEGGGGGAGGGGTPPAYDLALLCKGKSSNDIYSARSTSETGWTNDDVIGNGNLSGWGIDAALLNGTIYAVYQGASTNYIYYTTSTNGSTWSSSLQLPSSHKIADDRTPAVAEYDGELFVLSRSKTNETIHYSSYSPSNGWNYVGELGNSAYTQGDVALCSFNGTLYEFHYEFVGSSWVLRYSTFNGTSWSNNRTTISTLNLPAGSAKPNPYAIVYNGKMYVFFLEANNGHTNYIKYVTTTNGSSYSSKSLLGTLGARSNKRISAAVDGNKLIVVYKGRTSNRLFQSNTTNGTTWSGNIYLDNNYESNQAPTIISF